MIEMKCPSCGAAGRIPPFKVNTRLVCKKCLKAFHITSAHRAVLGDPPIPKAGKSGGKSGQDRTEAFDEMAAKLSTLKLPRVSPTVLGAIVLVALLVGAGYWLFSRQSLETRSEIAANSLIKGDMKTVIDLCVPGTETEAIMWYGEVARKYNFLKFALAGEDPEVTIHVQGDTRGGAALVIATYSRKGTRIASSAFLESLQPIPSLSNSNQTLELPLFWVKDNWGNWVLDGKRTAVGSIPSG
jgi:hypothetical protein